ncbi:MAG: ECF transporter S component [Clostridiaceae bacterium]|nr:ECF transporter S component [Clostridiaceae bacterium]
MKAQRMKIRELTTLAMLAALSIVLVWLIHFPIFPAASYLEYDPADIPILIGTFAFGPLAGLLITVIAAVIQGLTVSAVSGFYGVIMHVAATGTFVLVAGNIYKHKKTRISAAVGLICGVLAMAAVMAAANLVITPLFLNMPVSVVKGMILPIIIPFNLIKAGINAGMTFVLYKAVSRFIKGEKKTDGIAHETIR